MPSETTSSNRSSSAFLRLLNSQTGRSLLILVLIALLGIGAIVASKLTSTSEFAKTYHYNKDSAGFSFQYPASFTNTSKPTLVGGTTGSFVAQQTKRGSGGTVTGFVRAVYTPATADNAQFRETIQHALQGGPLQLGAFNKAVGSSTYGDCSKNTSILTTATGNQLINCPLSSRLGTSYKGNVLFGASSAGMYEFDYWIQASYWNDHANEWGKMYQNLSYN